MSDKPLVLIVDDHADTVTLLSSLFEACGASTVTACNGAEGLAKTNELLQSNTPLKLIAIDVHMPEMNGIKASRAIRDAGFKGKIVVFTAVATGEWRKATIEAGVDAYINKTSISKKLVSAILDGI